MTNMVILPMDTTVARVVGLPTHLATPDRRNHSNYCDHVELELSKVFNPLQQSAQDHTKFEYRSAKKSLVDLSEQLRKKVVALGTKTQAGGAAASLDDI